MRIHELGHLVLYVRDLERSRRFYRDVLGWNDPSPTSVTLRAWSGAGRSVWPSASSPLPRSPAVLR